MKWKKNIKKIVNRQGIWNSIEHIIDIFEEQRELFGRRHWEKCKSRKRTRVSNIPDVDR